MPDDIDDNKPPEELTAEDVVARMQSTPMSKIGKMILENIAKSNQKSVQPSGKDAFVSTAHDEKFISTQIEENRDRIGEIVSELITSPTTLRFRVKLKDTVERVLSILLRYQHLLERKVGISRGEICKNLAVKYRKNLDLVLFELEKHNVVSITCIHGKNFYKINVTSLEAANTLRESLRKDIIIS